MKWQWVDPADATRTVSFELSTLTAAKRLEVAGRDVPVPRGSMLGTRWRHSFPLGTKTATITTELRYLLIPVAELDIDGTVIEPREAPAKPPAWVWLFVLANLSILLITKGGAIPGAIAGAGAAACVVATMAQTTTLRRIVSCALITAAVWGGFFLLLGAAT